ncbi:MAG: hypothetical protein ABFD00_07470 [Chloroherpetonaceae bacterium]
MEKNEIIDNYFIIYRKFENQILSKLEDFANVPKEQYFYELAYCICTPMSKAENALQVQKKLEEMNYLQNPFNPVNVLQDPKHYIRFHNQKSKYILENLKHFDEIMQVIDSTIDKYDKRNALAKVVNGFNLKESSHFLRNIGYRGLAILDRHILRNLKLVGVIAEDFMIKNWDDYFNAEEKFKNFAEEINIGMDRLDLVLWANETGKIIK